MRLTPYLCVGLLTTASSSCRSRDFHQASKVSQTVTPRAFFAQRAPVTLTLKAPFKKLSDTRFDRDESTNQSPVFPMTLTTADGRNLSGEIRVRGRNSRDECRFPKFRMKLAKEQIEGTEFAGLRVYKIATHCDKDPAQETHVLGDGRAVAREQALLALWEAMAGEFAVKSRMARITYVDSDTGATVATEPAFLFEDSEDVAVRLGGEEWAPPKDLSMTQLLTFTTFESEWVILNHLFQAFAGNGDWGVFNSNAGDSGDIYAFYNLVGVTLPQGGTVVMPQDLDLAHLVAPKEILVSWRMASEMAQGKSPDYRQIAWQVARARALYPYPEAWRKVFERLERSRTALEKVVQEAPLEASVRGIFAARLAALFDAVRPENFYVPTASGSPTILHDSPERTTPLCAVQTGSPLGVLASDAARGSTQVNLWDLSEEPAACRTPPGEGWGSRQGWVATVDVSPRFPENASRFGGVTRVFRVKNATHAKLSVWMDPAELQDGVEKCALAASTRIAVDEAILVKDTLVSGKIRNLASVSSGCRMPMGVYVPLADLELVP